eukprot:355151-Chlamydomonas_euryale.AAC.10
MPPSISHACMPLSIPRSCMPPSHPSCMLCPGPFRPIPITPPAYLYVRTGVDAHTSGTHSQSDRLPQQRVQQRHERACGTALASVTALCHFTCSTRRDMHGAWPVMVRGHTERREGGALRPFMRHHHNERSAGRLHLHPDSKSCSRTTWLQAAASHEQVGGVRLASLPAD